MAGAIVRLSLDRYSGAHVDTRADAEALADQRRARIRSGTFDKTPETAGDNDYRLKLVHDFALPGRSPAVTFGDKRAADITTGE